jgi:succinate dehydrogenase / fumarate reductase membrane anchor subunit
MSTAKHGTGHFIAERVSAIALLLLTPWFLISLALLDGGYDGARAWVGKPLNAIGVGSFILVTLYHTRLGVQVIIEDYIAKPGTRGVLLGLNTVICAAAALISAYALYSISFGG